jgi:hypothetical protein
MSFFFSGWPGCCFQERKAIMQALQRGEDLKAVRKRIALQKKQLHEEPASVAVKVDLQGEVRPIRMRWLG